MARPMKSVESVVMKAGTRSRTIMRPLKAPKTSPSTATATKPKAGFQPFM